MPTFAEKRLALEERAPRQDANMAWLEGSIELDRRAERAHQAPHLADHGCAFCIDMHWKRARAFREGEERL